MIFSQEMKQNTHSSNRECSQIVDMLQLESRRWLEGERFACRALAIPLEALPLHPHTWTHMHTHRYPQIVFLSALYMMKTTDVSHVLMISASGPFQTEKQMLQGSLYHEGHVLRHSFHPCPKKLQQWRSVFWLFFLALQQPGGSTRLSLFCQVSTTTFFHSRGLQMYCELYCEINK